MSDTALSNAMSEVFIKLLKELPSEQVVVSYLDGHGDYTAAKMIEKIEQREKVGLNYASDVLRISRDLLSRQPNRKKSKK